jgi:hypothetical protein
MVGVRRSYLLRLTAGLLLASLLLGLFGAVAQAQDYGFSVDQNFVSVYIQEDSSVDIVYDITFTCDPGAHPIDIVDVGLPNDYYDLSSAKATIDGQPVSGIYESEWLDTGVEVHLGGSQINPGETGTLHLEINNHHMVYPDTEDEEYASVRFHPHYYEGTAHGTTDLRVTIYFPPGVQPGETRYHDLEFTDAYMEGDRPVMVWKNPQAQPDRQYQFGVSFPKQYVREIYEPPKVDLIGAIFGLIGALASTFVPFLICGGFILWIIVGSVVGQVRRRSRLRDYMPPLVSVEGMGIKRGLTAVEAAVLLEAPLNKVLTMILFGLVKKRAVKVVSDKPLRLEKVEPLPEELHPYEKDFFDAIKDKGDLREKDLTKTITGLIKEINQKMKGFHAKDTIAYYKDIVARAWKQVEAADTPEIVDENLEWMMADEDFDEKMPQTFGDRPIPMPIWWWGAPGPSPTAASRPTPGRAAPVPSGPRAPSIGQYANTIVTGIGGISNSIVRNVSTFTASVTKVTHPVPVSTSRGGGWSGGGGGGGCACACACAGCACACAGGGR